MDRNYGFVFFQISEQVSQDPSKKTSKKDLQKNFFAGLRPAIGKQTRITLYDNRAGNPTGLFLLAW
jgi:hypothetical protein